MSTTSSRHLQRPRRFAPLIATKVNEHNAPRLKGVVFDVDGTLCLPQNYMFSAMRSALSIPKSIDILEHIHSLSADPAAQIAAIKAIKAIESDAMSSQKAQPGLVELMTYLTEKEIPKALCTRNFMGPVEHLLGKYLSGMVFEPIITRETVGVRPKPSPEGLWQISEFWGEGDGLNGTAGEDVTVKEEGDLQSGLDDPLELARRYLGAGLIMVGDSIDDMAAGYRAGAATVLLVNEENKALAEHKYTDLSIRRLDELVDVLDQGFLGTQHEA